MSNVADISEPTSEVERLIADLSESGRLIFVFGDGFWAAHLTGATTPVFRGPADRRWWHVTLGDDVASLTMDVRVDQITGVRFLREPYPFPSFPGREVLGVQFVGPGGDTVVNCGMHDLYDGQRMRPEKLAALAGAARTLRQPRRVKSRPRHPSGPGCLTQTLPPRLPNRLFTSSKEKPCRMAHASSFVTSTGSGSVRDASSASSGHPA